MQIGKKCIFPYGKIFSGIEKEKVLL